MTYSILARDPETGALGAAAATGSLCVGGWVLRGDCRGGLTASQGAAPSTIWGEDALELMRQGSSASAAVHTVISRDSGSSWRQIAALDRSGGVACHTGRDNSEWHGSLEKDGLVVAGNLLSGQNVLIALRDGFLSGSGTFAERLLAAIVAGEEAGGDIRGLQSAALLVVSEDFAPLTLRIDWSEKPIQSLLQLYKRCQSGEYSAWLTRVPTRKKPEHSY
ncbi:MAG: DUF1028 domain-containing protein [Hyphomicrobiales bacterium]|nr:DUF1028 domain-containing protein [Hyphomicrobiales bacterium]